MEPKEQQSTTKAMPSGVPTGNKKLICLAICIAIAMVAWFLPAEYWGFSDSYLWLNAKGAFQAISLNDPDYLSGAIQVPEGAMLFQNGPTVLEQRVIAIFLFAAAMWITEPIPIWATSVLTMVLMLLTVSTGEFSFMKVEESVDLLGGGTKSLKALSANEIMAAFANPTIMLFMGGFILAIAAQKYKMDAGLAKVMLKPFGKNPDIVVLGFLIVAAMFSMFMSNTATAAMMLTILTPVLASLPSDGKGRIGLALAIPIACNVGGIGTPIGTPPNAIAKGFLEANGMDVSFFDWMRLMVPIMIIILLFSWQILIRLFPFSPKVKEEGISIEVEGNFEKSTKAYIVYITFAVTVILWVFGGLEWTGKFCPNANVVALIPFAVFSITGVITKKDLASVDWDVLWLVAGGFALGVGLDKTGLGAHLVASIPLKTWPILAMMIGAGVLCIIMSTFMSNSGTAALLVPILAAAGMGMKDQLASFGGVPALLIGVALSASLAMSLPISTPPNAIAYSKGFIETKQMAVVGILVGVFGMVVGYSALIFFGNSVFGN
ncbi:MAG: SLC13 family permease [Paludibacteraceae bacterium]|nr:SLC13 family permease [Paludibacteraceae bacterium]